MRALSHVSLIPFLKTRVRSPSDCAPGSWIFALLFLLLQSRLSQRPPRPALHDRETSLFGRRTAFFRALVRPPGAQDSLPLGPLSPRRPRELGGREAVALGVRAGLHDSRCGAEMSRVEGILLLPQTVCDRVVPRIPIPCDRPSAHPRPTLTLPIDRSRAWGRGRPRRLRELVRPFRLSRASRPRLAWPFPGRCPPPARAVGSRFTPRFRARAAGQPFGNAAKQSRTRQKAKHGRPPGFSRSPPFRFHQQLDDQDELQGHEQLQPHRAWRGPDCDLLGQSLLMRSVGPVLGTRPVHALTLPTDTAQLYGVVRRPLLS